MNSNDAGWGFSRANGGSEPFSSKYTRRVRECPEIVVVHTGPAFWHLNGNGDGHGCQSFGAARLGP